jgi:hypothetical protein
MQPPNEEFFTFFEAGSNIVERVAALAAAIGHPDRAEFRRSTHEARSFAELKAQSRKA